MRKMFSENQIKEIAKSVGTKLYFHQMILSDDNEIDFVSPSKDQFTLNTITLNDCISLKFYEDGEGEEGIILAFDNSNLYYYSISNSGVETHSLSGVEISEYVITAL